MLLALTNVTGLIKTRDQPVTLQVFMPYSTLLCHVLAAAAWCEAVGLYLSLVSDQKVLAYLRAHGWVLQVFPNRKTATVFFGLLDDPSQQQQVVQSC
jgi:hypothetical protein